MDLHLTLSVFSCIVYIYMDIVSLCKVQFIIPLQIHFTRAFSRSHISILNTASIFCLRISPCRKSYHDGRTYFRLQNTAIASVSQLKSWQNHLYKSVITYAPLNLHITAYYGVKTNVIMYRCQFYKGTAFVTS